MKMGDTMVAELKQMFTVSYYCFSHADCLSLTCSSQQHTGKVSISLDAWTSKNQIAFIAIVVHYVTNDWRLGKPIFLSHLYYSFALLEETLIDFKELPRAFHLMLTRHSYAACPIPSTWLHLR